MGRLNEINIDTDGVLFRGTLRFCRAITQAIIDQEIAYAKNAGITFFAYVVYFDTMEAARNLHMSSTHKSDVKYCFIMDENAFANWSTHLDY